MTNVGIVQALIPHYRQPVFTELASRPGIDLTVYASLDSKHGSLTGTGAVDEYATVNVSERLLGPFIWDSASIRAAKARHDVLILSWRARALLLPRAIRLARRKGSAVVVWGHGLSKNDSPLRQRMRLKPALMADACLFYDPVNARKSVQDGIEPRRAFAAPNAVDQTAVEVAKSHWTDQPGSLEAFQKRVGINPAKTFIFISRIEPDKRLEILLDAMKRIISEDPEMTLVIVGDGTARAAAEARSEALGLGASVRFLGAIYDEKELAGWCLSSICMSYPVAVGLSVMHAFGYGLPVITSDDIPSHNPEINAVRDGENGIFYREGDPGALAEAILTLARDPELHSRMSAAALDSVHGEHGWSIKNMVNGFIECIDAVQTMKKPS